jgi:hypothetical protein
LELCRSRRRRRQWHFTSAWVLFLLLTGLGGEGEDVDRSEMTVCWCWLGEIWVLRLPRATTLAGLLLLTLLVRGLGPSCQAVRYGRVLQWSLGGCLGASWFWLETQFCCSEKRVEQLHYGSIENCCSGHLCLLLAARVYSTEIVEIVSDVAP